MREQKTLKLLATLLAAGTLLTGCGNTDKKL